MVENAKPNAHSPSKVLFDTSIAIFLEPGARKFPETSGYEELAESIPEQYISPITIGELWKITEMNARGARKRGELENFLKKFTILPLNDAVARDWARLHLIAKRARLGISENDAWVAATALHFQLPLLTHDRNMARFGKLGLTVLTHLDPLTFT